MTVSSRYDIAANTGWVAVGQDGDTAAFAAEMTRSWRHAVGRRPTQRRRNC
jgi:hypothetical protein